MNRKRTIIVYSAVVAALVVLPLIAPDDYFRHLMVISGIFSLVVMGLNIIVGYTGPLSFVHMGFFGLGAYTSAVVTLRLGWSFWVSLPVSVAFAVVISLGIGALSLRIADRLLFSIVTLGWGEIIHLVVFNLDHITGGPTGIPGISGPPDILLPGALTVSFSNKTVYFYLVAAFCLLGYIMVRRLVRSDLGNALVSIRGDEQLASSVGIPVYKLKLQCFVLSSVFPAVAGVLFAHYARFVGPDMLNIGSGVDVLIMLILGGTGTLLGPIVGAVLLTVTPEFLRMAAEYRLLVYGVLLTFTVIAMPQGIVGAVEPWIAAIRRRYKPQTE